MTTWIAIGVTAFGCYAVKLLGLSVPAGILERPLVKRLAALVPLALLAALTALQTFSTSELKLVVDARAAGLAAAAVALLLRAPFLVVIGAAVLVTAAVRALTG
ncbi:AzlD domain-containing protein [Streptomyces sp. So13.3]|uniref:AzlD domain-containing protein n=1 Tax=Streptomyces fildesensis TaxID=375757 RepID=A0ABW8C8W5_9ACTN|nr:MULTISPECIES: AzlD domain-containing protein [Streptomyces]MCM2425761.1 AzlD domain-containing protein [Streptomyces sp. RKAG337]MCZ4095493.1 AzlD domain-containing protein [Streptomyces sp. H39-C1]NEA71021.1 AzlD domain-containing protein [Streptomyces sp. SID13588]QNA75720.1 AzlD domain-containing protein [Streptomyces sp. So13.3]